MADEPEYNVYRSRRGGLSRRKGGEPGGLADLRRERRPRLPGRVRKPFSWGRVVKWLVFAVLAWLLLSFVVFLVSAQFADHASDRAKAALSPGGSLLSGSTILVLGSDARPPGSKEPGANQGPSRSDSIMLMHVGFGSVRKLSILRDSRADIPGHGTQKINAAYALGGPALTIQTVEQFLGNGLKINHIIEINFANFPKLIDSMGGITVHLRKCIHSNRFDGKVLILHKGDQHLTGHQALQFSRVRENRCAPNEDDRARAKRQQQVLSAMRSRLLTPSAFIRLPFIAWQGPRTITSDLHGPGMTMLAASVLSAGGSATHVLMPDGAIGTELLVSEAAKRRAVQQLLNG